MAKSKWIEILEWCVLAAIVIFVAGVFLTGTDQDTGTSEAPLTHLDE